VPDLLPDLDTIKEELKKKAPTYFTEDRLSALTYNDAAVCLADVNRLLAEGIKEPFAPNEDGRTVVKKTVKKKAG
jgi:hypothetical protein